MHLDEYPESFKGTFRTLTVASGHEYWVTVPRTGDIYIRCRRVPLAEVYCSVSENFPLVWTNQNRELSVELIPACGAAEVGEFAALPALGAGWDSSEKAKTLDSRCAVWR